METPNREESHLIQIAVTLSEKEHLPPLSSKNNSRKRKGIEIKKKLAILYLLTSHLDLIENNLDKPPVKKNFQTSITAFYSKLN